MNTAFESVWRDLKYAVRMLRKTPGFTFAAALTLALGVGANAAVFSVVNALLLEPLPFPHPERLALLERHTRSPKEGDDHAIGANGRMWFAVHDHATKVEAAAVGGTSGANVLSSQGAAYVEAQRVTANYFHVLGLPPLLGREFTADEDRPGGSPAAVLSFSLWQRMFGGDPHVLGQAITLRGEPYTVVGVMPKDFPITQRVSFTGGSGVDLWTPLRPSTTGEGSGVNYEMMLRVKDGVAWDEANTELHSLSSFAFVNIPKDTLAELGLTPMQAAMTDSIRQPLLMLWGAVAMVLLIACVNIAGLLLARSANRTREIATRMALGSGRGAVVRQLLVESAVLALVGGGLGLAFAWLVLAVLGRLGADVFGLWQPIAINGRGVAVTLGIALLTSVVFGLMPALQTSRLDVQAALVEGGGRGFVGASNRWPRRLMVLTEIALSVVLLISAGLLTRTFMHLRDLNPGFADHDLITASVSLQDARYHEPVAANALFEESLRRIRAIPGVENAGLALGMPYTRLLNNVVRRLDGPIVDPPEQPKITNMSYVTPGFFETLQVPVRAGRVFSQADTIGSPAVTVVNEAFVQRYYKDDPNVMGRHLGSGSDSREIVGVVGNVQQGAAGWGSFGPVSPLPTVYIPAAQTTAGFLTMVHTWFEPAWIVRSRMPTAELVPQLRKAIAEVDPRLPVANVRTPDDYRGERLSSQQFMMWLVAGLGVIALVLASVGIHGLMASTVNERTREFGIRLALGASARQTIAVVVLPGMMLATAGVAIGSLASLGVTRLLQSFVWGVRPSDPVTFGAVIGGLLFVALIASLMPAVKILRLDPAQTLRAE